MITDTLNKYWTEASAFVGILLTALTATGQFDSFLPTSVQGWVATAIGIVTWVSTVVFHRQAVKVALKTPAPPTK